MSNHLLNREVRRFLDVEQGLGRKGEAINPASHGDHFDICSCNGLRSPLPEGVLKSTKAIQLGWSSN